MSFDQRKYIDSYQREKYERLTFRLYAGERDKVVSLAKEKGVSVNQLIRQLLADAGALDP